MGGVPAAPVQTLDQVEESLVGSSRFNWQETFCVGIIYEF